jgi:hypothetical protein
MGKYEDFGFDENPDEPEYEQADPGTIAFLDQQEAEFASNREKWLEMYGFDHECRCSQDYTEGKVGQVTQCFMRLMSQALARCVEATHEIRVYTTMMDELLAMNNDLVKMMEDLGHEKELQDYLGKTLELEDGELGQMDLQIEQDNENDTEGIDLQEDVPEEEEDA